MWRKTGRSRQREQQKQKFQGVLEHSKAPICSDFIVKAQHLCKRQLWAQPSVFCWCRSGCGDFSTGLAAGVAVGVAAGVGAARGVVVARGAAPVVAAVAVGAAVAAQGGVGGAPAVGAVAGGAAQGVAGGVAVAGHLGMEGWRGGGRPGTQQEEKGELSL